MVGFSFGFGFGFSFRFGFGFSIALPFVWFIWTYHCHRAASYALNTRLLQLHLAAAALCTVHCFCRHLAPFYGCSFLSLRQISGPDYQEYLLSLWHLLVFLLLCSLNFENTRELQTAFSVQLYSFNLQLAILQLPVPSTVSLLRSPDSDCDCDSPVPSAAPSDSCR